MTSVKMNQWIKDQLVKDMEFKHKQLEQIVEEIRNVNQKLNFIHAGIRDAYRDYDQTKLLVEIKELLVKKKE